MSSLQAFDQLARRAIDPALQAIADEKQGRHSEYAVSVQQDFSPARTRCLLIIQNQHVLNRLLSGSIEFSERSADTIFVKRSYLWINNGTPLDIVILKTADVTETEIARLACEFVADFFQRVQTVGRN